MKKLFILILAGMMAAPSFAQFGASRSRYNHDNTESYYGVRMGLTIASMSSDMAELDTDSRTGWTFGGVYGLQLANSTPVWLEAGLSYSEKGGESKVNSPTVEKITYRMSYLELPVVVKYGFDIIDDLYIDPFIGGYMALGIGGKTKTYTRNVDDRTSESTYNYLNRFDAGLRVGCGVEYQMLYAELGFNFGITNIGKSDFDAVRNRNLFINVGVNF